MDVGIDTENEPIEVVDVDLIFRKPIEITNFELVKTFWIDPSETINSIEHPSEPLPPSQPDQESKQLQPLALNALSAEEDEGSSCSHSDGDQLPEEVLNESMDDDVFEEEIEDVETDLLFRHPENRDMELVYTISKGATVNLDELEDEDEDVDVDLWFREPTDTRFELVYTIPLMEDVSVDSFGDTLEDVPPPEELDNVVEEAAEFTFKPIENDEEKTETDTLTTEVVTVLERRTEENVGEGSRDFIEKVKLTSNDTFDEFDGEEEAFQNAFVKSVETPETPVPEGDQEETEDASVSDVLKDAAEKLKIIQESETTDLSADRNTVESEDAVKETASAPDILESSEEEIPEVSDKLRDDAVESEDLKAEKVEESTEGVVESNDDISSEVLPVPQNSEISTDENVISSEVANDLNEEYDANGNPISPADIKETTDETENRFNVDPVEETSVPSAPEEDVAKPLRVESESTISDFAQLESVYAEDVPDVYKTLDSLRNEDIFPKEDTPAAVPDIPTIEVTPEAESQKPDEEKAQAELKLEDSGILETPGTAEVNETDIKETLNAEDVFTGISEELPSDDQKIDISEGMETVIKLEDSGISATPVLKEEGAKKALKSEDAGSDFPETVAPEDEFQLQNELKLEDSGISEIPNIDGTNESEIKNALNEEDVIETSEERPSEDDNDGVTPEVPESQNPNEATPIGNENEVVTVIKLEDSGIIDTPVLEKKVTTDDLNSEEVVAGSELSDGPGNEPQVQNEVKLEDSGMAETPADLADIEAQVITDALNAEDVVKSSDEQKISETTENQDAESSAALEKVDEVPSELKLEDSGIIETPETVGLTEADIKDDSSIENEKDAPAKVEKEYLPLEDSGLDYQETPEVVEIEEEIIEAALNEGDVVKSLRSNVIDETEDLSAMDSPHGTEEIHSEVKIEDSGTSEIVGLSETDIKDSLNGEDVIRSAEDITADELPLQAVSTDDFSIETRKDAPVEVQKEYLSLEDSGLDYQETPEVVEVEKEIIEAALNEGDVAKSSKSDSTAVDETEELPVLKSTDDTKEEVKLEDSGITATGETVDVEEEVIADALNYEDVVTPVAVKQTDGAVPQESSFKNVENESETVSDQIFQESFSIEESTTPSIDESVADSQTEEEEAVTEVPEKETTPVQEEPPAEALPVDEIATSGDDIPQKQEEKEQETSIKDSEHPDESSAKEESFVEKLVSMVENVIPVDAVLPSEDVLNEEHTGERKEEEVVEDEEITGIPSGDVSSEEKSNTEEESVVQKLVSMVENILPTTDSTPTEDVPVRDTSETPAEVDEAKESTLFEDSPSQGAKESTVDGESMMQKLVSMVESVLPTSDADNVSSHVTDEIATVEVKKEETAKDQTLPEVNEPTAEAESLMEKLVQMVESVLPGDALTLSEYVEQVRKNSEEKESEEDFPNEATVDAHPETEEKAKESEMTEDSLNVNEKSQDKEEETDKMEERLSENHDEAPEDQSSEEPKLMEKLVSLVESIVPDNAVLPFEDVLNEEHVDVRTGEENIVDESAVDSQENVVEAVVDEKNEENNESPDSRNPGVSFVDKVVELVENAFTVEAENPSEGAQDNSEKHEKVVTNETESVPIDSLKDGVKTGEEECRTEETILDKLVSVVEEVLPTGIMYSGESTNDELPTEEATDETQNSLENENRKNSVVAEVIATADIILPVEETDSGTIETPFDAEGFVSENQEENDKMKSDEAIISTADFIPRDSDFVENVGEIPIETENETSNIVQELVAMAVDILPIDGTVAENIQDVASEELKNDPNSKENEEEILKKVPLQEAENESSQVPPLENVIEQNDVQPEVSPNSEFTGREETVPEAPITSSSVETGTFRRVKRGGSYSEAIHHDESDSSDAIVDIEIPVPVRIINESQNEPVLDQKPEENLQIATVMVDIEQEPNAEKPGETVESIQQSEEPLTKTMVNADESHAPHTISDLHFTIPKVHGDYGNDYVPFGTEPSKVEFNNPEDMREEEEDVVAELNFHPIRQWKDEDVISLQSLKSLVAEVGCTTDVEEVPRSPTREDSESTLKILKVVPSEPSLMELDITNDPSVIHVQIPLMEPATKYLEDMVDWIISDAVKEVSEMEVVTESELSEMVPEESEKECVPEPLTDLKLPYEDDEKTPEPENIDEEVPIEVTRVEAVETTPTIPQRPPRAPKTESSKSSDPPKSRVRFGPLNIKLGRSYSEEQQKELVESLERPLTVITQSKTSERKSADDPGAVSPLSPNTLAEYEQVPMMEMHSVPHSPQEKEEFEENKAETLKSTREESEVQKEDILPTETKILGPGKSMEYVGNEDEDGSECLDSIGDLSERTIQRFNTSIDDPSIRRDSFSSISSFGDRQKFRTAIENIRQDLLPFQSSVSQYLDPSVNPSQQLLVTNLSMDSPSDLSPNAPPVGFENTAQYLEKMQQQEDRPSAEGSIDSSGFEKVDHEGLEDYGAPVQDPMQKSVYGSLTTEADDLKPGSQDDGFVFIERNEANEGAKKKMSSHHDDVIEKNYFGDEAATAKLLESPIAEEARKLVQDAVESASEYSKNAVDDADEIGRELLDNVQHKIEQVKEPVADTLHKAYDGLGDFVHETVPEAVHDFVEEAKNQLPESPVPEKIETPEPLVDIHDSVDKVHDEIDNLLRAQREPTPPLVEVDEEVPSDEKPQFGNQTPEEDETTFDRKGPLTIPEEVEKAAAAHHHDDIDDFDPLVTSNTGAAFGAAAGAAASEALTEEEIFGHQKFETVPRPPTPPKDISDEDVKPSTVNLGPAHHHSHPSSPHHSILKHHGEAWIDFKTVPPCVLDVIYWRDAKKSAVVLSLALLALFILAKFPLLTVITYTLLLALGAAAGFRVYKKVEAQIKKTDSENPFSEILSQDLSLPQEKVHAQADVFVEHATCIANTLKKLVFVESPLESIKFGLILWSLTYVASWFSGFTLAILGLLGVFSIPKLYEANQEAIDPHLATISGHLKNVQNLIDEKLPFLRSAPVATEEKKVQ